MYKGYDKLQCTIHPKEGRSLISISHLFQRNHFQKIATKTCWLDFACANKCLNVCCFYLYSGWLEFHYESIALKFTRHQNTSYISSTSTMFLFCPLLTSKEPKEELPIRSHYRSVEHVATSLIAAHNPTVVFSFQLRFRFAVS